MFKFFSRSGSRLGSRVNPGKEAADLQQQQRPLKLKLELDFLDYPGAGAGETADNELIILPSTGVESIFTAQKLESETGSFDNIRPDNGNQDKAVEAQSISKPEVQRGNNGVQKEEPSIENALKKTGSEFVKSDIHEEFVKGQRASTETGSLEQRISTDVGLEAESKPSPISAAAPKHDDNPSDKVRKGVSTYQSQRWIHGHHVNASDVAHVTGNENKHEILKPEEQNPHPFELGAPGMESAEEAKSESRFSDALPKILELARGDPAEYGCKKHSLRKLRKHLINNGIANISHETLRKIIADNGIQWNGMVYHKKNEKPKEKIMVIDRIRSSSTMAPSESPDIDNEGVQEPKNEAEAERIKAPGQTIARPPLSPSPSQVLQKSDADESEYLDETGNSFVTKLYYPFILNDYVKSSAIIQKGDASPGAVIVENASERSKDRNEGKREKKVGAKASTDILLDTGADANVYVDVPHGIDTEINNIKSFGPDFDPAKLDIIESYSLPNPLECPVVYIVKDGYKLRYLIKEPVKPAIYSNVREVILRNIDLYKSSEEYPVARLNAIVDRLKKKYSELKNLSVSEERALRYYLFRDFIGYREIDAPMNDDNIEDITCVGYGIPVFIYHQKYYNLVSDVVLHERELDAMVLRLAQEGGKHISISEPIVDATLRNGTRAQLTFKKTATEKGSTFTLRRFRSSHITPVDLIEKGTYTPEAMAYLWKCVQKGRNVMIIGGTATGKTTNLNACSLFIPPEVKIVSIEDTREIKLYQKNWIPSVTTRDIDTFSLLKAALRQRPEYIIVGEVRGKEAQTLFQAMASGHVVMSTFHAGSVEDLVNRFTSSPIEVPPAMLESLDIIVVLKNEWTNTSSRHRFADAIYEQRRIKGVPRFVKIYSHEKGLSASLITPEIEGKIQCLSSLLKEGVRNPDKVSERIISQMYAASASESITATSSASIKGV